MSDPDTGITPTPPLFPCPPSPETGITASAPPPAPRRVGTVAVIGMVVAWLVIVAAVGFVAVGRTYCTTRGRSQKARGRSSSLSPPGRWSSSGQRRR